MIIYQCEDTPESIFTAIYNAYEERRNHNDTRISLDREYYLFAEYVPVVTDPEKSAKVVRTLQKRFGERDCLALYRALTAPDPQKAQAVYQAVVKGLAGRVRFGHLLDNLADDDFNKVFALDRAAGREQHHLYGFLRFEEVQNGILYGKIAPKNNLLTFLMPHFADRFPMENFIIHDCGRGIYGIHPAGREWYVVSGMEGSVEDILRRTEGEEEIQELFRHFCENIAIKARANKDLQRNMLPLRYRPYMTEFAESQNVFAESQNAN